ncbi:MAG: cyclic nucleotide-binding domain-containing protein [Actinobacteria bacterium]|nr:cyclic nucleotide-binding domain-containing protein [Actinomycetota bacterium]
MSFFDRERPDLGDMARLGLFEGLADDELDEIVERTHRIKIKAGDVVMLERFSGEQFLVILEGQVAIVRGGDHVANLGAGDFIGEIGMLTGGDRTASVFAQTDTKFLAFNVGPFEELILGHPLVRARVEAAARDRGYGKGDEGS